MDDGRPSDAGALAPSRLHPKPAGGRSAGTADRVPTRVPRSKPPIGPQRPERVAYLDYLKLLMVAVIIAGHGALAYGDIQNAWPYQDVQEVHLAKATNVGLAIVAIPAAMFAMGLFFLISGLFTPGSISRKGPRAFARDRLIRLGAPLAVWALVIWPGSIWLAHLAAGTTHSFWWQFTHEDPTLDTGPMWFVETLLLFSLAYAAWRHWRGRRASPVPADGASRRKTPLSGRTLVALAVGISAANLMVRPIFPAASNQIGQVHLWQWPQVLTMFGLGIVAAQRGWLTPVPARIRRGSGFAALAGLAAFLIVALLIAATGVDGGVIFDGGLHWPALALAVIEGPLAIGASVWLLGFAQRHLSRPPGPIARPWRAAHTAPSCFRASC